MTVVSQLLEPSLSLLNNNKLRVFPHLKKKISNAELKALCTDDTREVYYNITVLPKKGKLILGGSNDKTVEFFSQSDINNGLLFYQHTEFSSEYLSTDSFMFDIFAEFTNHLRSNVSI